MVLRKIYQKVAVAARVILDISVADGQSVLKVVEHTIGDSLSTAVLPLNSKSRHVHLQSLDDVR